MPRATSGCRSTFAPPPAPWWSGVEARFDLIRGEWPDGARRYVVTAVGAGFDAAVARRSVIGGRRGTLPYVSAIVATLASHVTVPADIEIDGAAGVDRATEHRRGGQRRLLRGAA